MAVAAKAKAQSVAKTKCAYRKRDRGNEKERAGRECEKILN